MQPNVSGPPTAAAAEADDAAVLEALWAARERLIRVLDGAALGETEPAVLFGSAGRAS